MTNLMTAIEAKLMPIAEKMAQQRHLSAIRDAYISLMPFIIISSILLVIASFPSAAYQQFMASIFGEDWDDIVEIPFNVIFSTMAMFISFLVAYRLAESYGINKKLAGTLSLFCFLLLTPVSKIHEIDNLIPMEWLGSKGLFVAMLSALTSTELFAWMLRQTWIVRMQGGVPPAVQKSFTALFLSLLILVTALAIRLLFARTDYHTIHQFVYGVLANPIRYFGTSYIGALFTCLSITSLWSVGINSGAMVNGILRPFWMENQAENLAATQAGVVPPHVVTEQFYDMIWMGGAGATLSLVLAMLLFARSQHIKNLSRLAVGSSIFNINEPALFGLPVIMNPIMLIPFNLVPLVLVTVQYFAMSLGQVATTTGVYIPWTVPPILNGFIVTGHLSGAVIQVINLLIGAIVYLPFLKIVDKQHRANESTITDLSPN